MKGDFAVVCFIDQAVFEQTIVAQSIMLQTDVQIVTSYYLAGAESVL